MQPDTQQPSLFDVDRDYIEVAQRRYPFSFRHGRVRGDGRFALIAKCTVPGAFSSSGLRRNAPTLWTSGVGMDAGPHAVHTTTFAKT
jgi:hypothetical protein